MKRHGYLYQQICTLENLELADRKARKGKSKQYGVQVFDGNREELLNQLLETLTRKQFKTSEYTVFKINDPKERIIYRLPYFPDRILHHAIMNVIEPILTKTFTQDTYSCIRGRGVHRAARKLKAVLRDKINTKYCLKIDIKQFYPSVDHTILKTLLSKKFKDKNLLNLLYEIIDSAPGLPIGNLISQSMGNFYLCYFDHWIKQEQRVQHYYRYCDDIVILHPDKQCLHKLLHEIRLYLGINFKLEVKANYQIFPVESRGIDFLGYKFYHTHTLLRKRIKLSFKSAVRNKKHKSYPSYLGWAKHCNAKHLIKSLQLTNV